MVLPSPHDRPGGRCGSSIAKCRHIVPAECGDENQASAIKDLSFWAIMMNCAGRRPLTFRRPYAIDATRLRQTGDRWSLFRFWADSTTRRLDASTPEREQS